MVSTFTYLDYNATAPIRPEAAQAMMRAVELTGNPSSVHRAGRLARRAVDQARREVATLVNAAPEGVVFTSGGTEANNLALRGLVPEHIVISAIEHESIKETARISTAACHIVPVSPDGVIDLGALENLLATLTGKVLVSVMLANNETGVIQPIRAIAERAHAAGALMHTDAVQASGKIAVDFAALEVDLMSISAHKIGGPKGVGALLIRPGLDIAAQISGGGQELRRRGGTENVSGIVGFGAAARLAAHEIEQFAALAVLRDDLETRITAIAPEVVIFGREAYRLSNTLCFSTPGLASDTQVIALDLAGVAVSSGAACSSGKVTPSGVLRAMGASDDLAGTAIRVSFGWTSMESDIDRFITAWRNYYDRVHSTPTAVTQGAYDGRS